MKIHPTAIIDSSARLHESVEVGPYTIVEGNVTIDEGTRIASSARIYSGTRIGRNNRIYHNATLGCDPQHLMFDLSTETELIIGDGNIFRENVNISRSTYPEHPMRIGNNNMIMSGVHLAHDCKLGDNNLFVSNSAIGGHVEVGNRAFISGVVGMHQFCRVGDFALVAGLCKVTRDVPPFCIVDGNPAGVTGVNVVGLRRAGFSSEVRRAVQEAYRIIYHSNLVTSQAIQSLKAMDERMPEIDSIISFLESSKRGIVDYSYVSRSEE
jgi:UDP-N-acetylglucosamine acyltransferase